MPIVASPAEDLIDEEFPSIYRPLIEPALRRAYSAADMLIDREAFLNIPSARPQRGDLIMLAVEHEFYKLVKDSRLPFDASWEDHATPTGKHLVLRSPRAIVTISQVEHASQKPRYAAFRTTYGARNMAYLFEDMEMEAAKDGGRGHIVLLHGHGSLRFCNLAVPHPSLNRLVWRTADLLAIEPAADEVAPAAAGGEGPTTSPDLELVEDILRAIVDGRHGG